MKVEFITTSGEKIHTLNCDFLPQTGDIFLFEEKSYLMVGTRTFNMHSIIQEIYVTITLQELHKTKL